MIRKLWLGAFWVLGPVTIEFIFLFIIGVVVAVATFWLHDHSEFVQEIDRYATDLLMRQVAQERQTAETSDKGPRFLYVDIGEKTCREWARDLQSTSCTLGIITSRRGGLAESIIQQINNYSAKPSLVVIDIELAPLPKEVLSITDRPDKDKSISPDCYLRKEIFELAKNVPVIVPRPMVIDPEQNPPILRYPSILDRNFCEVNNFGKLWFACNHPGGLRRCSPIRSSV